MTNNLPKKTHSKAAIQSTSDLILSNFYNLPQLSARFCHFFLLQEYLIHSLKKEQYHTVLFLRPDDNL
jgi:hypothetical protein